MKIFLLIISIIFVLTQEITTLKKCSKQSYFTVKVDATTFCNGDLYRVPRFDIMQYVEGSSKGKAIISRKKGYNGFILYEKVFRAPKKPFTLSTKIYHSCNSTTKEYNFKLPIDDKYIFCGKKKNVTGPGYFLELMKPRYWLNPKTLKTTTTKKPTTKKRYIFKYKKSNN
uniref:NTR domain-containing protein n=1 Tax=Parastrongyloides trichosuri TaxID=131310 RepID=A0A0N4ZDC7_PARTI